MQLIDKVSYGNRFNWPTTSCLKASCKLQISPKVQIICACLIVACDSQTTTPLWYDITYLVWNFHFPELIVQGATSILQSTFVTISGKKWWRRVDSDLNLCSTGWGNVPCACFCIIWYYWTKNCQLLGVFPCCQRSITARIYEQNKMCVSLKKIHQWYI